jgi:hypothetical protein
MSLNLNYKEGLRNVRCRTAIDFLRDEAPAARGIKPLFRQCVLAYEPIGVASPHGICHWWQSSLAPPAVRSSARPRPARSSRRSGKTNTMHWLIPPGYYESRVKVTDQLAVPYDTDCTLRHRSPAPAWPVAGPRGCDREAHAVYGAREGLRRPLGRGGDGSPVVREGCGRCSRITSTNSSRSTRTRRENRSIAMSILYVYSLDKQFPPRPGAPGERRVRREVTCN